MTTTTIVPPAAYPVSLMQVKQHLRIDDVNEDAYLETLIESATEHVEAYIGQRLINRTVRQYEDGFPNSLCVNLRFWPVSNIVSVVGYDHEGQPNTVSENSYQLKLKNGNAKLLFDQRLNFVNGLEIDLITGFGDSAIDIPSNVTRAILVLVASWYELRGANSSNIETAFVPAGLEKLLAPMRRVKL